MKTFFVTFATALAFLVAFSFGNQAHAEQREIQHMNEILQAIDQGTLVVFDLDNTVMEPIQTLGTDQWFHHQVKKYTDQGADQNMAIDHAVNDFVTVQRITRVRPVEQETPGIIRVLQAHGVKVMALTARPASAAQTTIKELASIGVDFSLSPVYPQNTVIGGHREQVYVRGIALISPHGDKGTALVTFLRQIGQAPRNIVFVDDILKNVMSVETALTGDPYLHTGFRYAYTDREVAEFNPAVADTEWKIFVQNHFLISDAQALRLIGGGLR